MLLIIGTVILLIILVLVIFKILEIIRRGKQEKFKSPEKPPLKKKTESIIYCPRCHYKMSIPFQKPDDIYGNVKSHLCPVCHTFMRIL